MDSGCGMEPNGFQRINLQSQLLNPNLRWSTHLFNKQQRPFHPKPPFSYQTWRLLRNPNGKLSHGLVSV